MDWTEISAEPNLSIAFVKEYQTQLNWWYINRYITLSETFIQVFSNILRWDVLPINPSLTIELIEKIKDYPFVEWDEISNYYPVTFDMYMQFQKYINHDLLESNPNKKVEVERTETFLGGGKHIQVSYAVKEI